MNHSKDSRNICSSLPGSRRCGRGRRGTGATTLLTLLFVGLKLADQIDWSWWWVLSPLWIKLSLILLMILAMVAIGKRLGWKPKGET